MNRPRLVKGLRIAWTAWWGIVCVMLVVLWVRSYWWADSLSLDYSIHINLDSLYGAQEISVVHDEWLKYPASKFGPDPRRLWHWTLSSFPLKKARIEQFLWIRDPDSFLIRVPQWLLVSLSASLTGIPWFRWSKQFTLKTVFIATTLIAVVLGLVVWPSM